MEREGSGYDAVYETLLSQGKQLPEIEEGADWFSVTVKRRVFNLKIVDFIAKADEPISSVNGKEYAWDCWRSMKRCW